MDPSTCDWSDILSSQLRQTVQDHWICLCFSWLVGKTQGVSWGCQTQSASLCCFEREETTKYWWNGPKAKKADKSLTDIYYHTLSPFFKTHVKRSWVIFDKQLRSVVRASLHQLCLVAKVKQFLSCNDIEKAVHEFKAELVQCPLCWSCQILYFMPPTCSECCCSILTGTSRRDHIIPALLSLHWLPVHFRIDFKLLFVFNAITGQAPSCLSEILIFYNPSRAFCCSGQLLLQLPRSRLKQWGGRSCCCDCCFQFMEQSALWHLHHHLLWPF